MKLTKLLPIVSIAAVTSPMVTLCSCATTIELDRFQEVHVSEGMLQYLTNTKPFDMKANKRYCFNINMKNWQSYTPTPTGIWGFEIFLTSISPQTVETSRMLNYRVWIDNKELKYVDAEDVKLEPGIFTYKQFGKHYCLIGLESDINAKSRIKINVEVPKDIEQKFALFRVETQI